MQAIIKEDRRTGRKETLATLPSRSPKQRDAIREMVILARRQHESGRTAVYAEQL